jgi:hypothetical protein
MPAVPPQAAHDLNDFAQFLRLLLEEGFEFSVIGGCAVGAYARLMGEELRSVDLDFLMTEDSLTELLAWAPAHGIRVVKRPRPRNIPVAFLETPDGKEVNALTASTGLPKPEIVHRTARRFVLSAHGGLEVPLADPFDLLANKLAVARDKDRPHVEILRRFVEAEAVEAFVREEDPRARLAPSRRLLDATGSSTLPEALAERLIGLAKTPADFRFLAGRVPTRKQAARLLESCAASIRPQLEPILASRRFA